MGTHTQRSAAISVRNLSKQYVVGAGRPRALDGVDLDIHSGQVTMLMGPSGSGKTTLISIMGCILRPTSGSVQIEGRDVTGLSEKELPAIRLRHIGFVFQNFNLFPTLTARGNVELALDLRGIRGQAARKRAEELLDQMGLSQKSDDVPEDLSGGEKQRVAIARALVGNPEILLADEPTAALDSGSGKTVMDLLSGLARVHHRAVLIVTHDTRILGYADRIVQIADGRLSAPAKASEEEEVLISQQ
jgi:putative ABC transport system ATP-binding protein